MTMTKSSKHMSMLLSLLTLLVPRSLAETQISSISAVKRTIPIRMFAHRRTIFPSDAIYSKRCLLCRGGSTALPTEADSSEEGVEEQEMKQRFAEQKWRIDQQLLMQLRSTVLSESLAKRGVPITTLVDVSTAEGEKPPEKVDWDCAMSTEDEPKTCLYSFDAEPNTKVIAPIDTNQWITLSAINRLRRTDPTKVEPMWHSQYAILNSWFDDSSKYSLLQHVGVKGLLISLLLDTGKGTALKALLVTAILSVVLFFMPVLEYFSNRFLVSSMFWKYWPTWGRIAHAALPLKLLLAQLAWKFVAKSFGKLEGRVRDYVVDVECDLLESCIPLTVGPGSDGSVDEELLLEDENDDSGVSDEESAYFSAEEYD